MLHRLPPGLRTVAVTLVLLALIGAAGVVDHTLKAHRMNRAELSEWYCEHKQTHCGGPSSSQLEDAMEPARAGVPDCARACCGGRRPAHDRCAQAAIESGELLIRARCSRPRPARTSAGAASPFPCPSGSTRGRSDRLRSLDSRLRAGRGSQCEPPSHGLPHPARDIAATTRYHASRRLPPAANYRQR